MANVLNPETESTTLNTELETPTLEPAAEQEQPSYESTSNPELTEATTPALDADATTEPVAQATENPCVRSAEVAEAIPAEETAASAELSAGNQRSQPQQRQCQRQHWEAIRGQRRVHGGLFRGAGSL